MTTGLCSALVVAALLAISCAKSIALYPGPPRKLDEIAVLKRHSAGGVDVLRIDERPAKGYLWHLAPGRHRVWVEMVQYGVALNVRFKGWMYCFIDFVAEAGASYSVVSESDQRSAGAGDKLVTLGARIIDAAGETVGLPQGCSGDRPRFGD